MPARGTNITDLRNRLDKLQEVQDLPNILGVAALKLVSDCFLRETDPYGVAWKPLSYRRGRILRKTSRMFNSRSFDATPNRVRVAITARYSIYHQNGAELGHRAGRYSPVTAGGKFMSRAKASASKSRKTGVRFIPGHGGGRLEKRAMVPDERGLPPAWDTVLQRDTTDYLRRLSKGQA